MELARGLTAHGAHVVLATMGAPLSRDQRREASLIPNLLLHESTFKLEWMREPWDDVQRAGEWLLGIEEQFRPGIVHLNQYCFGSLPFRAPVLVTGHSCVLSWWRSVHGADAPAEWGRYRKKVTRGLRAALLVVAPTQAMLRALEQHYGALPRTAVIPNGRSISPAASAAKLPLLFAAGRLWDEAKNLAALEAIASELPWPVYVAGDAQHPDGRVRTCFGCRFLGRVPGKLVAWWLERASIFVSPARYEPFGLCALEAALAGCALVLGDIPSLREVWGENAVFVEPDDHRGLRRAVCMLTEKPELRLELARGARERALEFSVRRMADGYNRVYASLVRMRTNAVDARIA
jgi:glycosyltransferase involved in cell wall biosynthesis